jgi:4-methyl-5(b-hydroxyethyl)-thiazole monophosphate biosynthesis
MKLQADTTLDDALQGQFDLLFLPGGPGVSTLREDGRPAQLARQFATVGKPIGAICAAPTVLADAGLLAGRQFTAHFSVHEELKEAQGHERVVEDGNLITSRGAGTAVEFGLALVKRLFGETKAKEISDAIMF